MRNIPFFFILILTLGFAHISVAACMCGGGVNPEIYPPDVASSRTYYKDEFKGAAFTGKVLSSEEAVGVLRKGEKVQELTIEVDRYWFGVARRIVKIHTPIDSAGCWAPFRKDQSYFFIPEIEGDMPYLGTCTYKTFTREPDGNYVDFMIKMFGEGKRFLLKDDGVVHKLVYQ